MKKLKSLKEYKWLHNFRVKIFSLLAAFLLWLFVVTGNTFVHTLSVPVRLLNQPKDRILTRPIPEKVKVQFRGKGKNLIYLNYRSKYLEIDFKHQDKNERIPLTLDMIKGIPPGSGLTPQQVVYPDSILVSWDYFAEKRVPVRSTIDFKPMDGYIHVGHVRFEPDSIVVNGPRSLVNQISEVPTVERRFTGLIKEIGGKIALAESPWQTVAFDCDEVQYRIDIQRIGEKVIAGVPVGVRGNPMGIKVTVVPSTCSLKLQGGVKLLAELDASDVVASIDYRSMNRYARGKIPANITVPAEITFSDVKPQFFELIVER